MDNSSKINDIFQFDDYSHQFGYSYNSEEEILKNFGQVYDFYSGCIVQDTNNSETLSIKSWPTFQFIRKNIISQSDKKNKSEECQGLKFWDELQEQFIKEKQFSHQNYDLPFLSIKSISNQKIQINQKPSTIQIFRSSQIIQEKNQGKQEKIQEIQQEKPNVKKTKRIQKIPKKNKKIQKKKVQKVKSRRGKNNQSKTQKFLKYMTKYHFSKNFNQYRDKSLSDKNYDPDNFNYLPWEKQIELIDEIIQELEKYNMNMHYSVEKGEFLRGFTDQQRIYIQDFFEQLIRRTYHIKLQTDKRRIFQFKLQQDTQKPSFLDEQGQKQFDQAFDLMLPKKPYYLELMNCKFQERLWEEYSIEMSKEPIRKRNSKRQPLGRK